MNEKGRACRACNNTVCHGRRPRCKKCHSEYQRAYWHDPDNYEKHKERVRVYHKSNRAKLFAKKYGLDVATVEAKMAGLGQPCEICKASPATDLDHCHTTFTMRGALCNKCNVGISRFEDSIDILKSAVIYLSTYAPVSPSSYKR